jgi:TonB family protein
MRQLRIIPVLLFSCLAISAQNSFPNHAKNASEPEVIEAIAPDYPEAAISMRAEGRVKVAVKLSQKGVVDSAEALYGPAIFVQPALDAARRWRFVESKNGQKRIAELAFIFLITEKREENSISFFPPNQIEVVASAPSRIVGWARPRFSENDENPEVVKSVAPVYIPIAVQARVAGVVKVEVRIDDKGKVIGAAVKSGHPLLQWSSVTAAKRWEFSSSSSKKERLVTLSFVYNPNIVEKDGGPSFGPYQVEIRPRPIVIDFTETQKNTTRQ